MLASNYAKVNLSWVFNKEDKAFHLASKASIISGFFKFQNGLVLHEGPEGDGTLVLEKGECPHLKSLSMVN